MDVVNLHEAKLKVGQDTDDDCDTCIVTDDICYWIHEKTAKHFSIYVVFKEKMRLDTPFMLLYTKSTVDVTRLPASFVRKEALPMWSGEEDYQEMPIEDRLENEMIKLDFYSSRGNSVVYTWTDIYPTDGDKPRPMRARALASPRSESKLQLNLILPFKASQVLVLSEKSLNSYLHCKMKVKPIPISCVVSYEGDDHSMGMFKCGHCVCQKCVNNLADSVDPETQKLYKACPICNNDPATSKGLASLGEMTRLKLRHGPCPIDMCTEATVEMNGVVLIPCGCYVNCANLEKAVKKHKGDMRPVVRKLIHCPYDACRHRIDTLVVPYL